MNAIIVTILLMPILLMTSCEDQCLTVENYGEENIAEIVSLSPTNASYQQGTQLSLSIKLPASNAYFGNQINLFDETGDSVALVVLDDDLFVENSLTFIKGSQGKFPNWFFLPYNIETEMYELEVDISLDRLGAYSHNETGIIYLGPADPAACSSFRLNTKFKDVEGQNIEFTVIE